MSNWKLIIVAATLLVAIGWWISDQDDYSFLQGASSSRYGEEQVISAPFWPFPDGSKKKPGPDSSPSPSPSPNKKVKLVYITSENCHWCRKLEADWPNGFGVPTEKLSFSRETQARYRPDGAPCLILVDSSGTELKRQLGYAEKEKIQAFLNVN